MTILKKSLIGWAAAVLVTTSAFAEDYVIDTENAHAFVQFKASHLGYSYVIGRFNNWQGTFSYDENAPESAAVSVTIDAASLDSNHSGRDDELRSANFFDVNTYPSITFNRTGFQEAEDGSIIVTGDLELRGVQKSVQLKGQHVGHGEDPWGGYRRGLEATVSLKSSEFGFPSWVGKVDVTVTLEGIRQ